MTWKPPKPEPRVITELSGEPVPGWDKVVVSQKPVQFYETTYGSLDAPAMSPESDAAMKRDQNAPSGGSTGTKPQGS